MTKKKTRILTLTLTQAEVKGSWSWDEFDAIESTRVWVIYFSADDKFILASHNNTELRFVVMLYLEPGVAKF